MIAPNQLSQPMTDYFKSQERNILFRRIEHLEATMTSLDRRVTGHQLICHLNNNLREVCGLQASHERSGFLQRTILKWLVFHLFPWPEWAPRSPAALEEFIGAKPPTTFEADHAELVELLKTFEARWQEDTLMPHPVFGHLSKSEWGQYMFLHLDYHLTAFGIHGDFRAPK
jgi:hypothetical protein